MGYGVKLTITGPYDIITVQSELQIKLLVILNACCCWYYYYSYYNSLLKCTFYLY